MAMHRTLLFLMLSFYNTPVDAMRKSFSRTRKSLAKKQLSIQTQQLKTIPEHGRSPFSAASPSSRSPIQRYNAMLMRPHEKYFVGFMSVYIPAVALWLVYHAFTDQPH
jgi:hypothetical protein